MKRLVTLMSLGLVFMFGAVFLPASPAFAQSKEDVCQGVSAAGGSCSQAGASTTVNDVIAVVVNILSALVGIVAVIMIVIGGFKYVTSGGESSNIQSAKNTIMYAIVGLIIVALAQVITGFVLDKTT